MTGTDPVNRASTHLTLDITDAVLTKREITVRLEVSRLRHHLAQERNTQRVDPEYRSILVIDTTGSGRWDDRAQLRARMTLDQIVRDSVRRAGIAWQRLVAEDRGDGMILLLPATTSKVDIFDPMIPRLGTTLRDYNLTVEPEHRIRLRMAIHAGEVLHGPCGWVGTDLNLTCRLVNSPPTYAELISRPHADLVIVVSDTIHRAVVRHGYRSIDPDKYTPVTVELKEVTTRAWVYTPVVAA